MLVRTVITTLLLASMMTANAQAPAVANPGVPAGDVPAGSVPAGSVPAGTPGGQVPDTMPRTEFTQRDLQNHAGILVQELKKTVDDLTPLVRAADQRNEDESFYRLSQCQYQQTLLLMVAGETYNQLFALPPSLLTSHPPSAEQLARDPFLGSGRNPEAERNFGQALAYSRVIANTVALARSLGPTCTGRLRGIHITGLPDAPVQGR